MDVDKELLKGSISLLVLKLLSQGDMYGYQIIKQLGLLSNGFFLFKEGTLYPILHGLERQAFVKSYWSNSDQGRKRKYYHITSNGQCYFNRKSSEWNSFCHAVNLILKEGE